jgi:tRNA-splicing ligase RtcB
MFRKYNLTKINDYLFEIPKNFRADMRVPVRIYSDKKMLESVLEDRSLEQAVNVATLPGILKYSLAMPDIHEGYGFPIGGVAAIKWDGGVVSPGGIGYDINCGVRLLLSQVYFKDLKPHLADLADALYRRVPSGVGSTGKLSVTSQELDDLMVKGVDWMIERGYATKDDKEKCEENGRLADALPEKVSDRAKKRGHDQLGTLGSGNHFLEVEEVGEVFDEEVAREFGLFKGQAVIMIHTGSRGLGHQVATDYLRILNKKLFDWGYKLPDRELIYAPLDSREGQDYWAAMASAANFAWCNRQYMTYLVRQIWMDVLGKKFDNKLNLLYDVAHNIGKKEVYKIGAKKVTVCMHRKGATRAFGPGNKAVPLIYRKSGQPVIIPGNMGTASFVLAGTKKAEEETFGSVCHGAGRRMSRASAKRATQGKDIQEELGKQGILIRCDSMAGIAEEAPLAYKDIDRVVDVVHHTGLARKVVKLKPWAVVKGG